VLEFPPRNRVNVQSLRHEVAQSSPDTWHSGVMDQGRCHQAKSLSRPENLGCWFCPPSSPELHPIARLGQEVKDPLAWTLVAALEALDHRVATSIAQYAKAAMQSLTSYPYVVRAVHAIGS
jgi:hypothetical protein